MNVTQDQVRNSGPYSFLELTRRFGFDAALAMIEHEPPLLSVVIAATDSTEAIARAMEAIEVQNRGRVEFLVAAGGHWRNWSERAGSSVGWARPTTEFPATEGLGDGGPSPPYAFLPSTPNLPHEPQWFSGKTLVISPGASVPRLRRIGLEAARGRVVVFTEDSCLAQPGWLEAWTQAFADNPELVAASGLVEHDDPRASLLDRAVVFFEYAPFLRPIPPQRPNRLAGNNFAVLREVALELTTDEVHETALLAAISGEVRTVDNARVNHVRRYTLREAFGDRFRFGLEFGRLRTVGASTWFRWAGLIAGPAIFAVQVVRLLATMIGKRGDFGHFVASLPITLALLASWTLGEWLGWSLGPPTARKRRETAGRTSERSPGRAGSPRPGCKPVPPLA